MRYLGFALNVGFPHYLYRFAIDSVAVFVVLGFISAVIQVVGDSLSIACFHIVRKGIVVISFITDNPMFSLSIVLAYSAIITLSNVFLLHQNKILVKVTEVVCSGVDIMLEKMEGANYKRHQIRGVAQEMKVENRLHRILHRLRHRRIKKLKKHQNTFILLDDKGRPIKGSFIKMDFSKF